MGALAVRGGRYGLHMRGRTDLTVALWLVLVVALQIVAFEAVRRVFVTTVPGQQLDAIALAGNSIGQGHVSGLVSTILNTVSALSVIAATIAIGFIALMRRRVLLAAVATLMVVGANATTQVLKAVTERPELGIDMARAAAGNSLPSGHTTVTTSVAVALVLVLPAAVRGLAALVGAGVAAVTGVATLSAGWHRPSDAVAAFLVVGAWAAAAGLVLIVARRVSGASAEAGPAGNGHPKAVLTLLMVGLAALVVAGLGMFATSEVRQVPPELLSQVRLFVAYAGGAAGITGVAALVMALVLVTVHRVVPTRG
jgi:membrane-associated phospholipid phosphatase